MFSEYFHLIPDLCVRIGDIHHTGIHADSPDNGNSLSSDPYFTDSAAQVAVEPIRIADRNNGNTGIPAQYTLPSVSYRLISLHLTNCRNIGLKATDRP